MLRKQNRIHFSQTDTEQEANDLAIDSSLFQKLELDDVTDVIQLLEDESRIILDLFFYEEYSHKEIAELLEISVDSSRVRLHRAKKSFYRIWEKIRKNELKRTV